MAYDPTTDIGKVRLLVADTGETIFTDAELQALLDMHSANVYFAASSALLAIAADRAKLAKRVKREGYEHEHFALDEIRKLAAEYNDKGIGGAGGIDVVEFEPTEDHFEGYRPGWRDLDSATAVVE